MIISQDRLISIIREEIKKSQVRESSAMPPASVVKGGGMPPASVLGRGEEPPDWDDGEDVEDEVAQVTKIARRNANIKKSVKFFTGKIKRLNDAITAIDKVIERGDQEYRKLWFDNDLGTGTAGNTSDNDLFTAVREGIHLPVSSKGLKDLLQAFYDYVKMGKDEPGSSVEAATIEFAAKSLAKDSAEIADFVSKYPDLTGMTPIFSEPGCIGIMPCVVGNFPTMGDGWVGGGNTTQPAYRKGKSPPENVIRLHDIWNPKKPRTAASPAKDYSNEPD